MMSSTSEQYDAKKYSLCPPWDGQRGKSYYDKFIPNLTSSLGLRGDDFANQQDHLTGNVPECCAKRLTFRSMEPLRPGTTRHAAGARGRQEVMGLTGTRRRKRRRRPFGPEVDQRSPAAAAPRPSALA